MEDGAQEPAGQECAYDGHNDVDKQVRAVVHDSGRHLANHGSNDQVNENVHIYLLIQLSSYDGIPLFLLTPTLAQGSKGRDTVPVIWRGWF